MRESIRPPCTAKLCQPERSNADTDAVPVYSAIRAEFKQISRENTHPDTIHWGAQRQPRMIRPCKWYHVRLDCSTFSETCTAPGDASWMTSFEREVSGRAAKRGVSSHIGETLGVMSCHLGFRMGRQHWGCRSDAPFVSRNESHTCAIVGQWFFGVGMPGTLRVKRKHAVAAMNVAEEDAGPGEDVLGTDTA